jgi:hypothetical protein
MIGMTRAPDHNTLWRAFGVVAETRRVNRMLDLTAEAFARAGLLRALRSINPLTIDSTCFKERHRSHHHDRVCRKMKLRGGGKYAEKADPAEVNASRSRKARRMPKLSLAVASGCHLVLAARASTGAGSDSPDFRPPLYRARKRANVRDVVADAGYDAEHNQRAARLDMGVRSVIPPQIGRPYARPPAARFRRLMRQRFANGRRSPAAAAPPDAPAATSANHVIHGKSTTASPTARPRPNWGGRGARRTVSGRLLDIARAHARRSRTGRAPT